MLVHWGSNRPIDQWWLHIGTKCGEKDIFDSGDLGQKTHVPVNFPSEDSYIRLWYKIGDWSHIDFVHHGDAFTSCHGRGFHLVITI